ncbi:MAG: hypothetical protein M1834_009437 [Cirrosporium novae-zelandiae]|nr:MAG: hypothetical protein M1834_009437 [Cirrosporium novae-zelandiae]
MRFALSPLALALFITSLVTVGSASFLKHKPQACVKDHYLQVLASAAFTQDTVPFCSSYIHIPTVTSVITSIGPETTVYNTINSPLGTTTKFVSAQVTETITVTQAVPQPLTRRAAALAFPGWAKREAADRLPTEVQKWKRDAAFDKSVDLALSRACSCLHMYAPLLSTALIH